MKIYETAQELWPALIKQAGLDVRDTASRWRWLRPEKEDSYDSALLHDLHEQLFPGQTGSLRSLFKAAVPPLKAEALLRAFFATLRPFSLMKHDILEMMSAARAKRSDDNIKIRFQLNESDDPLDLLLNEFREQMEVIERHTVVSPLRDWQASDFWKIVRVGEKQLPNRLELQELALPADGPIVSWINQSHSARRIEPFPDSWRTGIDELDRRLEAVVGLLEDVLSAVGRYGGDYGSARETMQRIERREIADPPWVDRDEEGPIDSIGLRLRALYILESDYWSAAVSEWLLAIRIAARRPDSAAVVAVLVTELDDIIPRIRRIARDQDEIVRRLTDILNLPVWKKRSAVYAVWVASQTWQALKERWWFNFHLHEDTLSFAFSGVHLATLSNPRSGDVLAWWTELRTAATGLPSGHRSKGIQPDYRIRRAPFSAPDADVLIVEVKQYKQSSTDNFSAALEDYAFACQKAGVLLANYGPISPRVLEALPKQYRGRTVAAAFVRPDRKDNCLAFHAQVRHFVGDDDAADSGKTSAALIRKVELRWKATPQDLDLHLFQKGSSGQNEHIFYSQREFGDSIRLTGDVQTGFGPETLFFHNATGTWLVSVNQYSNDGTLASSGATVGVFADDEGAKRIISFDCPDSGVGGWWVVCELDFSAGVLTPINCIVPISRNNEWPTGAR